MPGWPTVLANMWVRVMCSTSVRQSQGPLPVPSINNHLAPAPPVVFQQPTINKSMNKPKEFNPGKRKANAVEEDKRQRTNHQKFDTWC